MPDFLEKIGGRAQKNQLFSELRQFQSNPRYAFESRRYALFSEYRVLGAIHSGFNSGLDLSFLGVRFLIISISKMMKNSSNFGI